ncbi:hypothetical protein BH11ACT4_BH11ACT4_05090 [soil metagenome]
MPEQGSTRLGAMLAEFSHPVFSQVAREVRAFDGALPGLSPRLQLLSVGRLEMSTVQPLGVVTLLALPSTPVVSYVRHLAAALLLGNSVLLAPLDGTQAIIAERMARACPGQVRIAGDDTTPRLVARDDALVILGDDWARIDAGGYRDERAGDIPRNWLCDRYSRQAVTVVSVRPSYVAPGEGGQGAARHTGHSASVAA